MTIEARVLTAANSVDMEVDSSRLEPSVGGPWVLRCLECEDFYVREIRIQGSSAWIDLTDYSSVEEAVLSSAAKGVG